MSLYNMLFGQNPLSDILLALLGLTKADVGRFRDTYIFFNEETLQNEIAIYTRNGGGNRECTNDLNEPIESDCNCCGCAITLKLPLHPLYLRDEDDDFDCTYATIFFKIPEELSEEARSILATLSTTTTPQEIWNTFITELEKQNASDSKE